MTEYIQARKEREESGFDINTFTIYWILKQTGVSNPDRLAPVVNEAIQRFQDYKFNPVQLRHLKAELYKILLPVIGKESMVGLVERILRLQRK